MKLRGLPTWSKRRYALAWADRAAIDGDILYVALGDSAAQGLGASAPEFGYVGLLADRIVAASGHTVRVVNLSVSGAKIADVLADQLPPLRDLDPDILTVDIGANDIRRFDESVFTRDTRTLMSALPTPSIVGDVPCFYSGRSEGWAQVAARIMREAASARGHTVVGLHAATEARRDARERNDFALDLFHPNDSGYRVWADAFAPAVDARARELAGG